MDYINIMSWSLWQGGRSMRAVKRLTSPRELAGMLDLSLSWIYYQVERGSLPHYKCGRYLRFDMEEVQAWLQQHKRGGRSQEMAETVG